MAEGLEFLLELDAKLEGALGMVRALTQTDDALKKVDAGLRKVEAASGKASAGHDKHGKSAQHTEGILHHFLNATLGPFAHKLKEIAEFEFIRRGVDALIDAPMEALHVFTELFEEMVKVSAEAERTNKSFGLLFGTTEGKETLEWIEGIAKFTEFTDKELKGMAQSLAKVGFEGEALTRALAASIDIAAFSGSGQAGAESALSSLERIKRTGRVDNRSLGGLGIGEKDFLAELSRRTGEGTATLKKKIDEGKASAEDSLEALYSMIAKKTGKDLGGAGVAMSETMQAQLTHLKDVPDQLFQKMADTKGFSAMKDFTTRLNAALDPESINGQKLLTTLTRVVDQIGRMAEKIDVNRVVDDISKLVAVLERLLIAVDRFTGIKNPISGKLEFPKATTGFGGAIEKGLDLFRAVVPKAIQPGTLVRKWLGDAEEDTTKSMANVGTNAGASFSDQLSKSLNFGGVMAGGAAVGGVKDELQIHSPSKVFENLGEMTGEGFNRGLDKSMYQTDDIARGAFAVPAAAAGARSAGPIYVETHITVHAAGGNADHIAAQVAEQVNEIIPGALQSAIERLSNQAGSS